MTLVPREVHQVKMAIVKSPSYILVIFKILKLIKKFYIN